MKFNFESISPNTTSIPFALLLFQETSYLENKVSNFFSRLSSKVCFDKSQVEVSDHFCNGNKNQDMGFPKKVETLIGNEDVEIVFKSLGIFSQPEEGRNFHGKLNSDDLFDLFEEETATFGEIKEAFDVFDENKDGFIDAKELQRVLLALDLKEGSEIENCRIMITAFDENNDERIDFQEFFRLIENMDC